VGTYEAERATRDGYTAPGGSGGDPSWEGRFELGRDVRFVLVAVGGGAIRVAHEIAKRRIRHLETVAINCDPKVQGFDEFDRRVYLGTDVGPEGDTGGSPTVGGVLARAAVPALDRIFDGATFVVVLGSLGGGTGSGALPHVLDVASRHAEFVSAFVLRPFRCEGERRALADRVIGGLHFMPAFAEKRDRGLASLRTLDNEALAATSGALAFAHVARHWADVLQEHIESSFLAPVEAMLDAARLARSVSIVPMNEIPARELPALGIVEPPRAPPPIPDATPDLPAVRGGEVELTFEIVAPPTPLTPTR
jgi:Tubulin/FtsZ family, GTPase domain